MNPFCPKCKTVLMLAKLKTDTEGGDHKTKPSFVAYRVWKCPNCKKTIKRR